MPDSRATASAFPTAARAGLRTLNPPFSPTHFHEEPDFKSPPGPDGRIAVGFSFAPAYWDRGYATEAVGALVAWALRQARVRSITADTNVTNVRSHRVLQKLGFAPAEHVAGGMARHDDPGDLLVWRLVKAGV